MNRSRMRHMASAVLSVVVLTAGAAAFVPASADTAPVSSAEPTTVSSDPLPTVQINGVVWDQLIVGNTVYVVGKFSTARPAGAAPGVGTVTRRNMLAYNLTTGALIKGFAPSFNAEVRTLAVSPDRKRIYVGGSFTKVSGVKRSRIAALTPGVGKVIGSFRPTPNSTVRVVRAAGATVYFGGNFTAVGKTKRAKAAAVKASNGKLRRFAPAVRGGTVYALTVSPDRSKVVLGGSFTSVNRSNRPGYGLAMVDTATGKKKRSLAVNNVIRNGGSRAAILSLKSDATGFYGSAYSYLKRTGNLEGSFRATWSGKLVWVEDCHGDTYDMQPIGDVVYSASHKHYCGNLGTGGFPETVPATIRRGTATTAKATGVAKKETLGYFNYQGTPTPTLLTFFPDINAGTYTGKAQGPWTVEGNANYVIYGGEFTKVNGIPQQGLVRFAIKNLAPNTDGPRLSANAQKPTLTGAASGEVTVTWPGNWDRDNGTLTYTVYRNSTSTIAHTVSRTAPFWNLGTMSFTDAGLTPGATVQYRVRAADAFGNAVMSPWVSTTVPGSSQTGPYTEAADDFNRAVSDGLTSAQTGGTWNVYGDGSSFSVDGERAVVTLPGPGTSRTALLNEVSSDDIDVSADVAMNAPATGGGTFANLIGRSLSPVTSYRANLVLPSSGDVQLRVSRVIDNVETTLVSAPLTGISHDPAASYRIRFQVVGTNPTTLRAKAWTIGSTEPGAWMVSTSDSAPALQGVGGVGLRAYVSQGASNVPQSVTFDNVDARPTAY